MKTKILLSILIFIMINVLNSKAQTYVGGVISTNTTWSISNSPYIVTDNIVVFANLTIESGVEVRFNEGLQLRIASTGSFNVNGNINDTIIFTSNKQIPNSGDWDNILIDVTPNEVSINYAKILYADCGI